MSDTVQIVTAILAFMGTVFTGIMAYMMLQLSGQQADAARKVTEVAATLEQSKTETNRQLTGLATVAASTHVLVNEKMGIQLRRNWALANRMFQMTGDPMDAELAQQAKRDLDEHQQRQEIVDAAPGTDAEKKGQVPWVIPTPPTPKPASDEPAKPAEHVAANPVVKVTAEAEDATKLILKGTFSAEPDSEAAKKEGDG